MTAAARQVRAVADLVTVCGGHRGGKRGSDHVDPIRFSADLLVPRKDPRPDQVEACADLLQALIPSMGRKLAMNRARLELETPQEDRTPAHLTGTERVGRGWLVDSLTLEASSL